METTVKLFVILTLFIGFITTPLFSRQDVYFGVRITELDSNILKNIWYKYIIYNIILAIIMIYLIFTLKDPIISVLVPVFAYIFLYMLIYIVTYNEVKSIKKSITKNSNYHDRPELTIIDLNLTKEKNTNATVSPYYFLIPIVITLVTIFITFIYYDKIPETFPVHYNISGEVDRWARKSFYSVLLMPISSILMTGLFYLIYKIIGRSKQELNSKQPVTSAKQNRKYRKLWSIYTVINSVLMACLLSYIHLHILREPYTMSPATIYITLGLCLIIIVSTLIMGFYIGKGGSKLNCVNTIEEEWEAYNADDDAYWIWGIFYCNKNDPSIFIEKRVGIGWTVNMATWQGKAFIISILIFTLLIFIFALIQ